MPANRKPKAWNLKPQLTAAPELWRGVVFATDLRLGAPTLLKSRLADTYNPAQDLTEFGVGSVFGGTSGTSLIKYDGLYPVTGSQNRTVLFFGSVLGSTRQTFISLGSDLNGSAGTRFEFRVDENANFALRVEVNSGFRYGTTNVADGKFHTLVCRLDGNSTADCDLFVDGKKESIGSTNAQTINTQTGVPLLIGHSVNSSGFSDRHLNGKGLIAVIWDYALTDERIAQISADPFAMLRPAGF